MLLVGSVFMLTPPLFVVLYVAVNYFVPGKKSVCVVVLGDIGRSPRMQYHSLSFLKKGFTVDLVGYGGSELQDGFKHQDNVTVHYLAEPPKFIKYLPKIIVYCIKVFWQSITLGCTLLLMPKCGFILMQNPPCIPSMFVCLLVCLVRGCRLVIDWHNYGYTIMGLNLGYSHPLVKIAKWYERAFGRWASQNICVTQAMQEDLASNWNIKASVMYDRPPDIFQETSIDEKHDLFTCLSEKYPVFQSSNKEGSVFTIETDKGRAVLLENRPALVVSSTSWTEDEDFGILLSALEKYEEMKELPSLDYPDIICIITGKGPLKEFYQNKIESCSWKHVSFCLPWLTPQDYPLLLGSADLGVCLHKSSSGLDLPMKVVDMFGCGLPVCAINFKCLPELVKHDVNGLIFTDSADLCTCIQGLLKGFPHNSKKLEDFRSNLSLFQSKRWEDGWEEAVLPLFTDKEENKKNR